MTLIQSLTLGIIQGITEFLPISSSAHLVLIPQLLGWEVQSTAFDITIHAATLLALVIYFRKDLISLITNFKSQSTKKLILNLIIASIPAGLAGLLLNDFIENNFKSVSVIVVMLLAIGAVMIGIDKFTKDNNKKIENLSWKNSLLIGLSQAVAFIRGTSRSGITMLGGLISRLDKAQATKFAFLAGIPIMAAVSLMQFAEFGISGFGEIDFISLAAGFLAALISGMVAIKFLLAFLKKQGLAIFGIYRIVLAILILILT